MAKFKVGDKVTDGNSVFQITKVNPDDYGWKLVKGDGKDASGKSISAGGMISWADQKMRKAANAVTSKNPVVANAMMARNGVKFDNPNYKAEDGIPFLDSHFDMFDKKMAKAMIEDAKKKGVRIPDSLMKKARESGILKNAVAKNAAISDEKELLRLVGTEMNQARAHLGNVIRNAKQGKAGGIKNFYTDHVSDLERIYNELWKF